MRTKTSSALVACVLLIPVVARTVEPRSVRAATSGPNRSTQAREVPFPLDSVTSGGTLYFSADDGTHGVELWKSDGTAVGTTMVRDIRPGRKGSHPQALTRVGGLLYFVADDRSHGAELWKSDGTEVGTVLVRDIYAGTRDSQVAFPTDIGGSSSSLPLIASMAKSCGGVTEPEPVP